MAMALEGIRVLELGLLIQGPLCASMLGDMGADVIKIEDPAGGDTNRGVKILLGMPTELKGGRNLVFEMFNRNKKSITLDLKKERAREILYKLVEKSDVFIQNFRPGTAARLGADYPTLSRINPRLIYADSSAFGPKGPDSGTPSVDNGIVARSGFMTILGEPGMPPIQVPGALADVTGALCMAYGIVVALCARERLGVGQKVEVSLLRSMMHVLWMSVNQTLITGTELKRQDRKRATNPLYNYYQCSDGKWLVLGMMQSDRYWPNFCKVLGIQDLMRDHRFENGFEREKNCEELVSTLDRVFITKTKAEWLTMLKEGGDLIYSPINTVPEFCTDPQVLENDYVVNFEHPVLGPIKMGGLLTQLSKTPGAIRTAAPALGQHTEEVLTETLGYSWDQIAELKEEGVI